MFAMTSNTEFQSSELTDWFEESYRSNDAGSKLRISPIRTGLSSPVARVSALNASGGRDLFIIKKVPALPTPEHAAYEMLTLAGLGKNAPQLLAAIPAPEGTYLVFEYVMRWRRWPWRELKYSGLVLDTLALLHGSAATRISPASHDYERELAQLAEESVGVLDSAALAFRDPRLIQGRSVIRRWVAELQAVRTELLLDSVFIHGDVHPGNVRIRSSDEGKRAVLLDWGRSRRGSPFEDVASWLQSLSYWEPEAARRHDLLLARYVRASGMAAGITREHRRSYWLAAGSNGVAGALIVHLTTAMYAQNDNARRQAIAAAVDWLRIIRRALHYWTSPSNRRFGTA